MHLQMEHGKKMLAAEHRLRRSRDIIEEKEAQISRLSGAMSTDTSIAMAMNVKTEVIINNHFPEIISHNLYIYTITIYW